MAPVSKLFCSPARRWEQEGAGHRLPAASQTFTSPSRPGPGSGLPETPPWPLGGCSPSMAALVGGRVGEGRAGARASDPVSYAGPSVSFSRSLKVGCGGSP